MAKIVGLKRSKGDFTLQDTGEVKSYDNVYLSCILPYSDDDCWGDLVFIEKVSYKTLEKAVGVPLGDSLEACIGMNVIFEYVPEGNQGKRKLVGIYLS